MITMQDLMENKVIGPWLQDKYEQGEKAGERRLLRLMIGGRFGRLSPEISTRLEQATEPELTQWAMRTPSTRSIDAIFA